MRTFSHDTFFLEANQQVSMRDLRRDLQSLLSCLCEKWKEGFSRIDLSNEFTWKSVFHNASHNVAFLQHIIWSLARFVETVHLKKNIVQQNKNSIEVIHTNHSSKKLKHTVKRLNTETSVRQNIIGESDTFDWTFSDHSHYLRW